MACLTKCSSSTVQYVLLHTYCFCLINIWAKNRHVLQYQVPLPNNKNKKSVIRRHSAPAGLVFKEKNSILKASLSKPSKPSVTVSHQFYPKKDSVLNVWPQSDAFSSGQNCFITRTFHVNLWTWCLAGVGGGGLGFTGGTGGGFGLASLYWNKEFRQSYTVIDSIDTKPVVSTVYFTPSVCKCTEITEVPKDAMF